MIERDATWPEMSFSDRMETTEFKVSDKPHIVVDGKVCADCSTASMHRRLSRRPVRADQRRRHRLQLRAVLRMRHVLPRLRQRGRDHLVVPRRRIRRDLSEYLMIAVCIKWIGGSATAGLSAADEAAIEIALRHGEAIRTTVIAVTVGSAVADDVSEDGIGVRRGDRHSS